jgi:hypothetical protein
MYLQSCLKIFFFALKTGSLLKFRFFLNNFLVAFCYLVKFTFIKSTQKDGSFDSQHYYILWRKKFRP